MRTRTIALVLGLGVSLPPLGVAQGPGNSKALDRGVAFAKAGRVDLFVASSAVWGLPANDDRNWNPALKLGVELAREGKLEEWPPNDCPKAFLSAAEYRARFNDSRFVVAEEPHVLPLLGADGTPGGFRPGGIIAPGVSSPRGVMFNVIISRGPVKAGTCLSQAVVYATGDVTVGDHLASAVVVCDGDVTVGTGIESALVVARGKITAKGTTFRSVLVAGGRVTAKRVIQGDPECHTRITENELNAFGFVRFFELSRVGVKVSVADKVVRIDSVADAKVFALAGGMKGDVIEGVNGTKPESEEALRRLLRDALAVGDAAVTVRRGDKVYALKISLPE
jgi:hypothetical protein